MRIAHVSATFPPYYGGTGNVCYRNARELARRGHAVHVFTAAVPGAPATEVVDGISVTRLRSFMRYGNARLLPGLLRHLHGYDVIHLHYPFVGGEVAALSALASRTPFVITYHQDVLLRGPLRFVELFLRHTFGRFALRQARRVLFTTLDYGRESYVYPMLDSNHDRIGELPNGVDIKAFSPSISRDEARVVLGLPVRHKTALLVAALDNAHYFKGVDVFLESISRLPSDTGAVIIGDGDMRLSYETAAASRGLASRVRFVGRVPDVDLPLYYRAADVTVLPSTTMGEAFGLVLLESMACGTPVIASDLPGVRTVVSDAYDGFLVPPGNPESLQRAMQKLLEDPSMNEEMGRQGRKKVENRYDWQSIGGRLEGLYCEIIHERRDLVASPMTGED